MEEQIKELLYKAFKQSTFIDRVKDADEEDTIFYEWYKSVKKQVKNIAVLDGVSGSEADYWSTRCELAETCNEESPCDPDVTPSQIEAWKRYHEFIKVEGQKNYR